MLSYIQPTATLQQVLRTHSSSSTNSHVQKVLKRIVDCRTSALGYHAYQCSDEKCRYVKYCYHSCRDRHCPMCGAIKKQQWIEARMQELLPVKYFHVVFTLPHELNSIMMGHRKLLFELLLNASAQTLLSFAKDSRYLGALPGIISVLHTWGQQLSFHPHIHCIVSGGGIQQDNKWKEAKKSIYRFLFPVKAISMVYKARFLEALKELIDTGQIHLPVASDVNRLFDILYEKQWIVYAKAPFAGPQAVIEYLGRYTHKVAISNHRINSINDDGTVTFSYKDYADGNAKKQMTLNAEEFIRRFEQHILPRRFTKIRSYGYLANRGRHQRINEVLSNMKLPQHKGLVKLPVEVRLKEQCGLNLKHCPCCEKETLVLVAVHLPWKKWDDG